MGLTTIVIPANAGIQGPPNSPHQPVRVRCTPSCYGVH
jgi:hypothetical protein